MIISLVTAAGAVAAGTFSAFGPELYIRDTGTPVTVSASFTVLDPNATYNLVLQNGGLIDDTEIGELVSSTVVTLNGSLLIGPEHFNQNIDLINVPVHLETLNTLSVELRGKPGGVISLLIEGVDNEPPEMTMMTEVWMNFGVLLSEFPLELRAAGSKRNRGFVFMV